MPRKPRLHVPGALYHVTARGNARQPIFFSDADIRRWMELVADGGNLYRCRIHAYCWMSNHIHMAVQVSDLQLGRFIGWVTSKYARAINKRLDRSGHLFERRYGAKLVDSDSYLLQLVRYIHLNPVAAKLVADPADYVWSSHRAYLGYHRPTLLTLGWVLSCFGPNRAQARAAYRRFMAEQVEIPQQLVEGNENDRRLAGCNEFLKRIENRTDPCKRRPSLSELIDKVCRAYGISEAELASPGRSRRHARIRAEIAEAAHEQALATFKEIATRFNRTEAAISRIVNKRRRSSQPARE